MNHVMIDLETLGQEAGCVITSVSAVQFDLETGNMGESFHRPIQIEDQTKQGLTMDPATVLWWMQQSSDSREKFLLDNKQAMPLGSVLYDFARWLWVLEKGKFGINQPGLETKDIKVWGRGPRFDLAILAHAYRVVMKYNKTPWDFRNERCVRTYEAIMPHIKTQFDAYRATTVHDGISDAIHQIAYVCEIHKQIKTLK